MEWVLLDVLDGDMIFLNREFRDYESFFDFVEEEASELGYINPGYAEALTEREKDYPTGLQLEGKGIAIPHTDSKYVKKEFIALTTFEEPVQFSSMEDPDEKVDVNFAFVLGIKDSEKQLETLQKIIGIIQDDEIVDSIIEAKDKDEILSVLS